MTIKTHSGRFTPRILTHLAASLALPLLSPAALAEDTSPASPARSSLHQQTTMSQRADRLNGAVRASELLGMTVNNNQDEKIGKVNNIAVDVESGRIIQVILSTGGFAGFGDTLHAVPPGALRHVANAKVVHLDADKEKLRNAPEFEMSKWAECCDETHLTRVYRHYGESNTGYFVHHGNAVVPDRNAGVTTTVDGGRNLIPTARLKHAKKVSALMGATVRNVQQEKLGQVENLLLDLPAGRIVAVIVSSGGFLGIGDELSAVPPTALAFAADRESLVLDVSKESLANAPHFRNDQWPDFAQPAYSHSLYRAYRLEPYFTTNNVVEPGTTTLASPDPTVSLPTPLDQGTSTSDVNITRRIRQGILDGKDMSLNARNVKVITQKGYVTLRGPVDNDEEKRLIGVIAIDIALLANVDNQLVVQ
jgi:sporulation protein YlmC with PRC-barrel domain